MAGDSDIFSDIFLVNVGNRRKLVSWTAIVLMLLYGYEKQKPMKLTIGK